MSTTYINAKKIPVGKFHLRVSSIVLLNGIKIEQNLFRESLVFDKKDQSISLNVNLKRSLFCKMKK